MIPTTAAAPAPSRAVAAVAVVGALVLLAGVALSARGVATEDLPTVLSQASEGTVLVVGGVERPARRGTAVPDGARVRTPAGGTAALDTDGRVVQLAPATTVRVLDGARQRLEAGSALVVAVQGRGLQLSATSARISAREGAVVRVEQASPVRVASYRGTSDVGVDGRRALTLLDPLHQVEVQGTTLPSRPAPLRLTLGDAWEREQLERVVEADTDLRRTVAGYAEQGGVVVAALLERDPAARGAGPVARAEQALALALAHDGGSAFDAERYRGLLRDRSDGGSWGVVAELNDASPSDADAYLRALSPDDAPGPVLAGGTPVDADGLDGVLGLPGAPATAATVPEPGRTGAPRPRPSSDPAPRPSEDPRPTDPDPLPGPLREIVETVLDVLPLEPLRATPSAPRPAPSVSPTRPPLVDVELDVPSLR